MLARLRALFRRPPPPPTVVATATGFELRGGTVVVTVEWARVRRAVAYKQDLLTADSIALVFELDAPAGAVEVSEEWPGFGALFEGMEVSLGVSPAWYLEIMTPAFEPTPRLLYERPEPGAGAPVG